MFTHARGQAESLYQRALAAHPTHAFALYNYAVLLEDVRGDIKRADEMYSRAVKASPGDALTVGDYATFMQNKMHDAQVRKTPFWFHCLRSRLTSVRLQRARELYTQALAADPDNVAVVVGFATLLGDHYRETDRAMEVRGGRPLCLFAFLQSWSHRLVAARSYWSTQSAWSRATQTRWRALLR